MALLHGHGLVDCGALALVTAHALLSVTDEIGVLDLLSLLVGGALFSLLIANLRVTRHQETAPKSPQQ